MFFHVLLMRFNANVPPDVDAQVEACAERVRRECAGLVHYHFGANLATRAKDYDRTIISVFESSAAHDAYQVSPAHQEMKARMSAWIADLVVADYDSAPQRAD